MEGALSSTFECYATGEEGSITVKDQRSIHQFLVPGEAAPVLGDSMVPALAWLATADDSAPVSRELYDASIGLVVAASSAAGVSDAQLVASLAVARAAAGALGGGDSDAVAAAGAAGAAADAAEEPLAVAAPGDADGGVDAAEAGKGPGVAPAGPYVHPSGSRGYLEAEVMPLLKRGMFEMAAQLERDRLKLLDGSEWTPEGHLPQGWTPFSPFRWLADWLMANRPVVEDEEVVGYSSYSDEQKAQLIFDALDGMSAGSMCVEEAIEKLALDYGAVSYILLGGGEAGGEGCGAGGVGSGAGSADGGASAGGEGEGGEAAPWEEGPLLPEALDRGAFVALVGRLIADAPSGYALDALVHRALGPSFEEHAASASDAYRLAYLWLDGGLSGYSEALPAREVADYCARVGLGAGAVAAALAAAGKGPEGCTLDCAEFVALLGALEEGRGGRDDERTRVLFAAATAQARGLPQHLADMMSVRAQPIDEIDDEAFAAYLTSLPGAATVRQARTTEVQDASFLTRMQSASTRNLSATMMRSEHTVTALVDVRDAEHVAVSSITGSVHAPVKADEAAPMGWSLVDPGALKAMLEQATADAPGARLRVILFDAVGLKSAAVVGEVEALCGSKDVLSLCGGIVNFYNQGGMVKDSSGTVVQALHPGEDAATVRGFISRPNTFKM
ncbi:hypothetical protein FOA52_001718 [Chlamydomonas sp. UWO 241]|nr:hypothetical protein FOA52_001718 [Chlamydomonas sp. UWO 241]